MGRGYNWIMYSENQTSAKLKMDRKLSLLIALWIVDKVIMLIMLMVIK
jgi:hypothetical protein